MKRTCGECTLCCKLLGVEELKKLPGKWCRFVMHKKGCSIYQHRPTSCREFRCFWLMDEEIRIPEELKPDHCNAVMATSEDGKSLFVWQNQGHPDAWSKKPMYDLLTSLAAAGVLVVISKAPGTREKIVLEVNGKGIVEKRTSRATAMDENGRQIVW